MILRRLYMFWNNLQKLCATKGITPTGLVNKLEISHGSVTRWKEGSVPRGVNLLKIADYFGVTTDELLESDEPTLPAKEDPPTATMGNEGYDRMIRLLKAFGQLSQDDQEIILHLTEKISKIY